MLEIIVVLPHDATIGHQVADLPDLRLDGDWNDDRLYLDGGSDGDGNGDHCDAPSSGSHLPFVRRILSHPTSRVKGLGHHNFRRRCRAPQWSFVARPALPIRGRTPR